MRRVCGLLLFVLLSLPFGLSASAAPLFEQPIAGFLITIISDGKEFLIDIAYPKAKPKTFSKPTAFVVDSPPRLVVDLPALGKSAVSKQIPIGRAVFSGVRAGIHPDKIRLVFDLIDVEAASLATQFRVTAKGVSVSLKTERATPSHNVTPTALTPSPPPAATPKTTPPPTKTPETAPPIVAPVASTTPQPVVSPVKTSEPALALTPALPPTPTVAPNIGKEEIALVLSISFKLSPNQKQALAIHAPHLKNYTQTQISPAVFDLVLENARLSGSHLKLAQFPPDTFDNFEGVTVDEKEDRVTARIFLDGLAKPVAFRAGDVLWIEATR